jgi:hypothetical protein
MGIIEAACSSVFGEILLSKYFSFRFGSSESDIRYSFLALISTHTIHPQGEWCGYRRLDE